MIERALRRHLRPIVNRRRRLHLARMLSIYWSTAGLIGLALLGVDWLWGWNSSILNWALCILTVFLTLLALYKFHRMQPDYIAVARNIERQHPEMQALLLAAIEQKPTHPFGQLDYLQERVIGEALKHATNNDWLKSISSKKIFLANFSRIAALTFIIIILSQLLPSMPSLFSINRGILNDKNYNIEVSPGDTTVELGTAVVILARFNGRVPPEAKLWFGPSEQEQQQIVLTRNLNDPVFGGLIPKVNNNLLYHIDYAGRRTRYYKISAYKHPALQRADAKIIYPQYTKLPEKVIKNTRQLSVVEGSEITLTLTLNKPVAQAQLLAKDQPALKLQADNQQSNTYTTSIKAIQSRRYKLYLADAQGLTNKIPARFVIDVHNNMPPELNPIFPNRDVLASPLEELSLEAEVSDDHGVTGYGLSYTLAGTQNKEITLTPSVIPEEPQIKYVLALEELNAQPDQLLTYYFWADDMGPDGNSHRTSSDMYFAEIRHFEQVYRESQSFQNQRSQNGGQGRQDEQLAQLQKQIISATWNLKQQTEQSGINNNYKEDLAVISQSQVDVLQKAQSTLTQTDDTASIKTLQEATKHMETSLDHLAEAEESTSATELTQALTEEQLAYQELLKLRDREHQIALSRNANRSGNTGSALSQQQLQQLELTQNENRYETQRLAQSQQQEAQREDLQVLNRLRDLARRQNEMSDRLREAEAALRQARDEQEEQEIRRELKRLREEQLEALGDIDELQQRMESSENRQRMAEARQQLNQSRSRIRQSAEELEQEMVSRAVTSTTRAQRQLEQMRDEFQRRTSGQFTEQMRNMLNEARQLDRQQKEISNEIKQEINSERKTLTGTGTNRKLAERIDQQRESTEELIEQMRNVSEQSEASEPLLSRKLYDTLRKASTNNIDRALEETGKLLLHNFLPQAQKIEQQAGEGIENIKKGVEEAAESVLGNEADALRLARQQLDELIKQADNEVTYTGNAGQRESGEPNQPRDAAQSGSENDSRASANLPTSENRSENSDRQINSNNWLGDRPEQWDMIDPNGPFTGRYFRQWSDRLRDVEEILNEQDLRDEVARIRDSARAIRGEFIRHGKEPQWDLVRQQIINPLAELRKLLSDKLVQLQSDEALVPIDRDPVPSRFAELVRRYYENLGGGD